MQVRPADPTEIDHLALLWHDAWHGSHAHLAPPELVRLRTLASFRDRLAVMLTDICVVGPSGAPLGLCALKGDELYQLFVSPAAHGTGVAAALIADAEARLAARGVGLAWLACAVGNMRAARFYEKSGWRNAGAFVMMSETSKGPFPVDQWCFEKRLAQIP
ncbi:Acetyltransferase (GNAT) domain-containing protein [Bradyrhizobium shewense]|uniref:Acetyltransferase (GNAT) domain-containing protein n=1 Tax=Bradyrhizobium shewense TaxID=1761772 RepID=A0A1C3VDN7_9BRAD|nr:GNAT family N-acetyltransferase [Bradyrhizobium shewense]SCB25799.1 Acetyltransferase (GNAT) domain-containing protein [Bradyrhizobium shewense]